MNFLFQYLLWWKLHSKMLPLLSTLARRILCTPATSAAAGLTIAKCRASLHPQHASELIFLHDSWEFAEASEMKRVGYPSKHDILRCLSIGRIVQPRRHCGADKAIYMHGYPHRLHVVYISCTSYSLWRYLD